MGRVMSSDRVAVRVAIYPAVTDDGIGTYVNGIKHRVGAETIPAPAGLFSIRTFMMPPFGYDVLHSPTTLVPLFGRGAKIVCTVQDIIPLSPISGLNLIARLYLRMRIWWSIRRSEHLIFTSRSTLNDVQREFGRLGPHSVIPLAVDEPLKGDFVSPYAFPYFFCVGRRRPHKNTMGIVEAFASIPLSLGLYLVFGGKKDIHDKEIVRRATELGIEDRLVFAGFLSTEQLASHYSHARSLVFTSFYEGFGLPILEAMGYGCPVITSNRSSMPEVAGEAAILVNPDDHDAMAHAMKRVHSDTSLRRTLVESGKENAKRYTWTRVATETLAVYKNVCGGGSAR
jgi:glycosyltransferase involved in cell wall biosynthesis